MSNQISIQTISFNNQSLITVEQNGNHYVAMKPICENIGIDWRAQRQRIVRDEVLCSTVDISPRLPKMAKIVKCYVFRLKS